MIVTLLDGPGEGTARYEWPLPVTLVIPVRTAGGQVFWHDYTRIGDTSRYLHSTKCKCHA